MKRFAIISVAGLVASLGVSGLGAVPAGATTTRTLILNGTAEAGTGSSNGGVVAVPDWTETTGASFTAVKYGATGGGFLTASSPGLPPNHKSNFFAGGPGDPNDSIVATQTVSLSSYVNAIKGGHVTARLQGWLGGSGTSTDEAFVEVDFKNKKGFLIGSSVTLGPVTEAERGGVTELVKQTTTAAVPKGARSAYVQLIFDRLSGTTYNDAFMDDIGLFLVGT
jgi:hypothetical protein